MAKIGAALPNPEEATRPKFDPPADGWFTLQFTDSGKEQNKPKTPGGASAGEYVWWEVAIMDEGPNKGKTFRHMANYLHTNAKTQQGGLYNLNCACKACGLQDYNQMEDTDQLRFVPFRARIESKPQKNNSDFFNTNIKAWGFEEDGEPPAGKSKPAASSSPPAETNKGADASGGDWRG